MGTDVIIGLCIIFAALLLMTFLVIKSSRTIREIHKKSVQKGPEVPNESNGQGTG